jgi:hypothetical protein
MSNTLLSPSVLPESSRGVPAPEVMTLLHPRNRRARACRATWEPPPGWEEKPPKTVDALAGEAIYPALRPGITFRKLAGSLVIHDHVTQDIHKLNRTATAILLLADGRRDLREVAEHHARRFGLDLWKAVEQVEAVLGDLIEKKVLVPRRERIVP